MAVSEQPAHQADEIEIVEVRDGERLDEVRALFVMYGEALRREPAAVGVLMSQGFVAEVAGLPGDYAHPGGVLLAATVNGQTAGCVGVRRLAEGVAELKRLYVRKEYRGHSLGRRLLDEAMSRSAARGYERLRLDTLPFMRSAMRLYREFGFVEIAPYGPRLMDGMRFFEVGLDGYSDR